MKAATTILAILLLTGCAGMGTSGGSTTDPDPANYNDPTSPFYYDNA
jgi:hypothetical protein